MLDPTAEGFTRGDLGGRAAPSLRVVALPADPESNILRIHNEFWEWWKKVNPSPPGTRFTWGQNPTLRASGTYRADHDVTDVPWDRYVAVRRHGGVDLGADVTVPHADQVFVPFLRVVALVWTASFRLQWRLHEHLDLDGPWEVAVALRDVGGSVLGQYAEGGSSRSPASTGVGRRGHRASSAPRGRRVADRGNGGPRPRLDIADHVEQCWGIRQRVYLIPNGDGEGEFEGAD